MAVQINVAANQAALTASIQAGVQAYNQRFAQNNPINLSINQRAFSQPLGRMTGDVKDFEAALAASNARVIAFGASTAVLGGVIRSFKELANVTIDVEKNLADINRVFGLTTGQLQKFSTDLFSVGKQTASSFDDASKAALEFSRQGLKAEEVLIRTKDALTLARVAGISTANSVDALTSTINGFSATGITTTQILNKLVAVEQDFAVGAGDLAEALSRTGQAAQEAGVSLDQLNALVTSAQQSTARGGAVIGNALKTIFTRLQRTDTLDQLEAFNVAVRDVQGNTLPAVTILQNFAGAYKGLADAQRAQLSEQVAGVYQVNILKAIVGDLNKSQGVYAGALQRGASATNEAEVATAKLNQTLDALLKQTATSTQQLANNIGKVTFEPLARYGTEQLKSLVESMNEILEGEGVGSTFANGLLKGIRNVIAGPGAIAAFFTLFKLIQNSFTYLAQALPQIAGITTETQNRKNIEQSILQIMQQQGPVSQALAGSMGNQAAQAQLLLQLARQQTAEYQIQSTLAKQLATQLAGQGVRVKGSGGLQVTRAGGYIPAATRMAEAVGAQAGGYAPGKVVKSPVGGVMNTAEDVKYVPGFAQPFINPPAGSKAGRAHRQNAISRTGVDPYMNSGFIPNFGNPKNVIDKSYTGHLNLLKIDSLKEKKQIQEVADLETEITNKLGKKEVINDKITGFGIKYDIEEIKGKSNATYRKEAADLALSGNIAKIKESMPANKTTAFNATQWAKNLKDLKNKGIDLSSSNIENLSRLENKVPSLVTGKTVEFGRQFTGLLSALSGEAFEKDIGKQKEKLFARSRKSNARLDFESSDKLYSGGEAKLGGITLGNLVAKAIESTGRKYENGEEDKIAFSKSIKLFVPEEHKLLNKGFIPNFAPPISMLRIPWFKKYANPSFDAKQPTLNIAGANAVDTFRSTQFRTNKTDYNKKAGDGNVFGPIYEKFVRSSISLQANKSKIKSLILGQSLEPDTIQGESSFDSFMELVNTNPTDLLDLVGIEIKGGPKDSQTGGSATGIITKKYNNFTTKNPKAAARLRELLGVFNEPGNPQHLQYMSALGKEFLPLAATNYDEIAKNSPELLKVLSQKTNELLTSYVNNPSFYRAEASGGFIPNFTSMISSSIKGKGNISAIKTGKNNYEIEGVEVGKKFRGQGLGSQLYGSIAQKIGSGSTIKSVLLPQEQALADYASGKSIPAKAIFPQLSWAKMAKSSKLLINGKEIAMSDFENGIAGHKYNAAKLDIALIELVNSHALGFIPNFAYQQAVMSLEEGMSGEKAIFDTKPFPHIRNKSQPTFSSAIADHGGLNNALSDSMRGQKDAGLMSKGFIPNFTSKTRRRLAKNKKSQQSSTAPASAAPTVTATAPTTLTDDDIEKAISDFINSVQSADEKLTYFESALNRGKIIESELSKLKNKLTKANVSTDQLDKVMDKASKDIYKQQSKFAKGLEKSSTTLAIAGPLIAGQLEQAIYGNRERTDMTAGERQGQAALSTGLTAISTGASVGAAFGPVGAGVGAAAGVLIGFISSIDAAKLSLGELTKIDQELLQKQQANSQAASSYIDNQKKLNDLMSSGASQKDISEATKNLSLSFNDIKDVKLAEIFAKTAGNVEKMKDALTSYTDDLTKKSAGKSALGNLQEGAGIFSTLLMGGKTTAELGVKEPSEVAAQLFKSSSSFANPKLIEAMRAGTNKDLIESQNKLRSNRVGGAVPGLRSDAGNIALAQKQYAEQFTKEFFPDLKDDSAEFQQQVQRFMDLLFGKSGSVIADGIEKMAKLQASNTAIQKVRKAALEGFAVIFGRIEQSIQVAALRASMDLEKDLQKNRIDSVIKDFTSSFSESIENFVMNSLPEGGNKSGFTQFTAQRKYDDAIMKQQVATENFRLSQQKERNDYQKTREENITKLFKDVSLQSEQSANFFESNIYGKVKSGDFSQLSSEQVKADLENKLIDQAKSSGENALSTSPKLKRLLEESKINFKPLDLKDRKNVGRLSDIAGKAQTETGTEFTDIKDVLAKFQDSLSDLYNTQEFFANKAKTLEYNKAIEIAKLETDQFNQRMENAKKLFEVNQILEKTQLEATKHLSIEKAKLDNDNLMRMEKMKDISGAIGNTLEITKANMNADISRLQTQLEDPRKTYGMGSAQISQRKFDIQDKILQKQRDLEDTTIKSDIQQRILQMAVEQENTNALYALGETIQKYMGSLLEKDLGSDVLKQMQNNPYMGKSKEELDRMITSGEYMQKERTPGVNSLEQIRQAQSYTPEQLAKFEAYQRTQQSSKAASSVNGNPQYNTNKFSANMSKAGFNKVDENGKLIMSQEDQINFLITEENKARSAGNTILEGTIRRYREEIDAKNESLRITREQLDEQIAIKNEIEGQRNVFGKRLSAGFGKLSSQADDIVNNLAEELPMKFADNMSSALMEVAKGTKSIGDAFQDMAINFGQMIMQEVMRAAIAKTLGNIGIGSLFGQAGGNVSSRGIGYQHGGVIRANNGQYVSGMGSGDRYPAMLENGEYVLNRKAVKELGGKKSLDAFNFEHAPRFASGGNVNMEAEMALNKDQEMDYTKNLLYNNSNIGAINPNDYTAYAYSENDYFKKMREKAIANEQKRVQEAFAKKQKNAQLISSIVGAAGSMFLAAGMSGLAKAGASGSAVSSGAAKAKPASLGSGMGSSNVSSFSAFGGSQRGGMIGFNSGGFVPHGSRLSDTIPALLTGGEYVMNNAAVRKYGLGEMNAMNAGAVSNNSNSNATNTNNNTNNNATNISINIDRSGKATYGSDTSSYEKNDIAFSKQMAKRVADIAKGVISDETRYGGKINQR